MTHARLRSCLYRCLVLCEAPAGTVDGIGADQEQALGALECREPARPRPRNRRERGRLFPAPPRGRKRVGLAAGRGDATCRHLQRIEEVVKHALSEGTGSAGYEKAHIEFLQWSKNESTCLNRDRHRRVKKAASWEMVTPREPLRWTGYVRGEARKPGRGNDDPEIVQAIGPADPELPGPRRARPDRRQMEHAAADDAGRGARTASASCGRAVPDISQRMLTQTLRDLQRDGLIEPPRCHPTVPPSVEYRLTPLGSSLLEPLAPLIRWASGPITARSSRRDQVHPRSGLIASAGQGDQQPAARSLAALTSRRIWPIEPRNAGSRGPVFLFDVSRGSFRKACVENPVRSSKRGQRRARFLHPEQQVPGITF